MNNSGETIDGEQREAIKCELKALAERHGLSVADLVQMAGKEQVPEIKHYPGIQETQGKNSALINYVSGEPGSLDPQVMRKQYEEFQPQLEQFCAKFGLNLKDKDQVYQKLKTQAQILWNLDQVLSEREDLYPGETVNVRRSSGEIQDGWKIAGLNDDGTFALRLEVEGGRYYPKNVTAQEIMNLNPQKG